MLIFALIALALVGSIYRYTLADATLPRCGDCRRQIPTDSGSCPYCGGRRG